MSRRTALQKRMASTVALLALGGALSAATWISGDHGFAVAMVAFYLVVGIVVYVLSGGGGDIAAIMRTDGDERQRSIDREATRLSALAMGAVALGGTVLQVSRGQDPGGYAWICSVGGGSYMAALAILRRRS